MVAPLHSFSDYRTWLRKAYITLTLLMVCFIVVSCSRGRVSPEARDVYLGGAKTDKFIMDVDLFKAPPSRDPLDILFLFDATASMENVINEVRISAADIMETVRGLSTNSAFGVASFADYSIYHSDGHPWRLHQDITMDTRAVKDSLGNIEMANGGDIPEAYSRALYESRFLHWREDARRFIILFGDAPAHDFEFYGKDFGVDPGRDGIVGTEDDLRFSNVGKQLAADKITVITIYDTGGWLVNKNYIDDAIRGFEFLAQQTDGLTKPVKSAGEIPDAIKAGLREKYQPKPVIVIPPEFRTYVTVSPLPGKKGDNRHFNFDVALHPPEGTPDGVYRFPLTAAFDAESGGGEIGRTLVTIRIGLLNYEWRWVLLPAYLFLLALLGFVKAGKRRIAVRFEQNGQYMVLCWRVMVVIFLLWGIYAIWRYSPGTLPPYIEDFRMTLRGV